MGDSYEELEKATEENDNLFENYQRIVYHLSTIENKYALAVNKIMEENLGDKLMSHELRKKLSMPETEYDKMKSQLDIAQEQLNKTKTKKLKQKLQTKEAKIVKKKRAA